MRPDSIPTVYLLASQRNGTLYVGVTSDLMSRVWQHRSGTVAGFTRDYDVKRLVWFEQHATMDSAILVRSASRSGTGPGSSNLSKPTTRNGATSPKTWVSSVFEAGFPLSRE